ncbi:hypothetical protein Pint_33613 [Pistacia integerrima]|uniref:Uncharacterized protein n=1 Tax=Pistacia integerrima TaxID=434235 RepID=A0ACC0X775_9ROSI|nr:hypothetical protein Pint_33613 [Pistacia integerrima]
MVKLKLKITIGRLEAMYDPSSLEFKKGLEKVWDVKPLVNGKEIMSVLQLKSGWPLIREWLAHPSATAEECLGWTKQTYSKRVKLESGNSVH